MLAIIEKVKDLFKCKCEKKGESAPQQQESKVEENSEEQAGSSEQSIK